MTAARRQPRGSRIGTPLGVLDLDLCGDAVVGAHFVLEDAAGAPQGSAPEDLDIAGVPHDGPAALRWLRTYFDDPAAAWRTTPAPVWPRDMPGTAFQRRVWQALQAIPPGQTRTYGELAAELGTAARAVGGACRSNPCVLFIPCHRVVAAGGSGGFMGARGGARIDLKAALLRHEAHAAA